MRIIIFEGIATSGKSSLANELAKLLPNLKVKIITEDETHEPIIDRPSDTHINFFKKLIQNSVDEKQDLVVFERLHLTQAFRSASKLSTYSVIEDMLLPYSPKTLFLKVDEGLIAERIKRAIQHRDSSWGEYVSTKGKDINEIAETYIQQQRHQLKLLEHSSIPYRVINTSSNNWQEIVKVISSEF